MSTKGAQDGFTLIEALVATCILAMISLAFALGAGSAVRYNGFAQSLTAATTLGHSKLEELTEKAATDAQLTAGNHADPLGNLNADGSAAAGAMYTRSWTVTDNLPTNGLKTVKVSVAWSLYGKAHTINFVMVHS
jgi:prepilin-type N-terminal cleavage/methylation domain-containing protein